MRRRMASFFLAVTSCQSTPPPKPPEPSTVETPRPTPPESPLRIVWRSVEQGSRDVPLNTELRIRFSRDLDPATALARNIRLVDTATRNEVELATRVQGQELVLAPTQRFFVDSKEMETRWSGLKPDTVYEVEITEQLKDRRGKSLATTDARWSFRTSELDYGLYWFDKDGTFEKPPRGSLPKFFDAKKPILLYLHGWQNGTMRRDVFREHPFLYAFPSFGGGDSLGKWRESGWNVAIFYWNQWADEPEVKDAQAKVWKGKSEYPTADGKLAQMRYRLRNGEFREFPGEKSVAELLRDEVQNHLGKYDGPGIRVVAHSLGSQLAAAFLDLVDRDVHDRKLNPALMPKRLVMLDPFWGKGKYPYLGNRTPAQTCTGIVQHAVEKHQLVVEQVKSSGLGGIIAGDENLPMRRISAFHRVWPDFIPLHDQVARHLWAYVWYLETLGTPIKAPDGGYLGAAASDEEVRKRMNFGRKEPYFYSEVGDGSRSRTLEDDRFERRPGVSTW